MDGMQTDFIQNKKQHDVEEARESKISIVNFGLGERLTFIYSLVSQQLRQKIDIQWEKDKEERLEAFLDVNRGRVEGENLNT